MYRRLSEKLVAAYDCDWRGNQRMKETCICGVEIVCSTLGNILVLIVLACLVSKGKEIFLFFTVYGMTRLYAGGKHARNHLECILIYTLILLASIYMAHIFATWKLGMAIVCIMVPIFTITVNVRYGGKQKKLRPQDRKKYQCYCRFWMVFFNMGMIAAAACVQSGKVSGFVEDAVGITAFALVAQSVALLWEGKSGNRIE